MKHKEKIMRLKKEKRNLKNKRKELRRKKEVQNNQEKRMGLKRLWSIPQPEEYSFESRGYQNLYHYTFGDKLPSILKYGVILGDVMTNFVNGFNSPNLTTESHLHNPSHTPVSEHEQRDGVYRLTINCPTDSKKLINYGWFDRTYCGEINLKSIGNNKSQNGDLDKQYIYLGHIDPSMISGIKVWNRKTKCWDRTRRQMKEDLCQEYESLKYKDKLRHFPDYLRICGFRSNDYTGMVKKYFEETDHKDVWKDVYTLSDYIVDQGFNDTFYKIRILQQVIGRMSNMENTHGDTEGIVNIVFETYNRNVSVSKRIDPDKFTYRLNKTLDEFETWLEEINEKSTEEYEDNLRMVS
jgi:hypothetical protein